MSPIREARKRLIEELEEVFEHGSLTRIAHRYLEEREKTGKPLNGIRSAQTLVLRAKSALSVGDYADELIINLMREEKERILKLYDITI